jgi:hypothetical protein
VVVDFRSPATPVVVGSTRTPLGLTAVAVEHGFALGADYLFENAVPIFDLGAPSPLPAGALDFSQAPSFRDDNGDGIAVREGVVFMVGHRCCGYADNGMTGDSALHIGRYAIFADTGNQPPSIALTAPLAGAVVGERTQLTIRADAADDVRVESVQISAGGRTLATLFKPPYETTLTVPGGAPQLTLGASATDSGGNVGTATPVTVGVTPNRAPAVALLAPRSGARATEGTYLTVAAEASDDRAVQRVEIFVDGQLAQTLTAPPYRYPHLIPLGSRSLQVSAVADDDAGASPVAGPVAVAVDPDLPPTAELLLPRPAARVIEGSPVTLLAGATDDVGLRRVEIRVNGQVAASLGGTPPYAVTVTAPPAGQTLRIQVLAEDTQGHQVLSAERVVTTLVDPFTTVAGRIVDGHGLPVAGADVQVQGSYTASSGVDGRFAVTGIASFLGDLFVSVSGLVDGCPQRTALADSVPAVPGGVVEIGDLPLRPTPSGPATAVIGLVVGPDGAPVTGATVEVTTDDLIELATATSGRDGIFVVPSLTLTSGPLRVMAQVQGTPLRAGVKRIDPSVNAISDAGTLNLALQAPVPDPGTTVFGTILDSRGQPAAGARVHIGTASQVFEVLTTAEGTFSLAGVPTTEGDVAIGVTAFLSCERQFGMAYGTLVPVPGGAVDAGTIVLRGPVLQ